MSEWERWAADNPDAQLIWKMAYREGVRQSVHLGLGTTIQQVAEILSRLERVAGELAENEESSAYWKTGV